jgi:hypothetical protein
MSTKVDRPHQKIFKISDEEQTKLKIAAHKCFMTESELLRTLIDRIYEQVTSKEFKS